jgi:hypothetical protein
MIPHRENVFEFDSLDVEVERFAILLHIRKVPGSNLAPETNYPCWNCSWLYQSHTHTSAGIVLQIKQRPFSSFPIHYPLIILPLNTVQPELLIASLTKPQTKKYRYNSQFFGSDLRSFRRYWKTRITSIRENKGDEDRGLMGYDTA